jgi:hypothetical protein
MHQKLIVAAVLAASTLTVQAQSKGSVATIAGAIAIDQARAEAGGVTHGDAPGFPITLSQPGVYRLTGNLHVADANTHAIEITADRVTLDLNGYSITGPVSCGGSNPAALICTPASGTGTGVSAANRIQTSVANGAVSGFHTGVYGGYSAEIRNLRIRNMRSAGIAGSIGSAITDNVIFDVAGPALAGDGLMRGNSVYSAHTGISVSWHGTLIEGNRIARTYYGVNSGSAPGAAVVGNTFQMVTNPLLGTVALGANLCNTQLCQ